jgi:hypothetical protein
MDEAFAAAYKDSLPTLLGRSEGYNIRSSRLIPAGAIYMGEDPKGNPAAIIHPDSLANPDEVKKVIISVWPVCPDCGGPPDHP